MFIEDRSAYHYRVPFDLPLVQTVGWLDCEHEYTRGTVKDEFIQKLWQIIETRTESFDLHANIIRGIHPCNFCGRDIFRKRNDGKRTMLGMSELWVPFGVNWFAAPSLIVHYVEEHSYLPPVEYIDAVMNVDFRAIVSAQMAFEKMCAPFMNK